MKVISEGGGGIAIKFMIEKWDANIRSWCGFLIGAPVALSWPSKGWLVVGLKPIDCMRVWV